MDSQQASSPEKRLCPICQDHLRESVRTDCGHFFCQACLVQQAKNVSCRDNLNCSVCRKPWSPSILGAGYYCENHQDLVGWFCEEKQLFLCSCCLKSPDHRNHSDPSTEKAINHYKERIHRKVRKLRKKLGDPLHVLEKKEKLRALLKQIDSEKQRLKAVLETPQTGKQSRSPLQQWLDRLDSASEKITEIHDKISEAENHLNELEEASKELNTTLLKRVSDLLSRSVPEKPQYSDANSSVLEQKVRKLLLQTSSIQVPCPSVNSPPSECYGSPLSAPPSPSNHLPG